MVIELADSRNHPMPSQVRDTLPCHLRIQLYKCFGLSFPAFRATHDRSQMGICVRRSARCYNIRYYCLMTE